MNDVHLRGGERLLLQIGAVAAIIGTVLQVAAGSSQSALLGTTTDDVLGSLSTRPDWAWPVIYLGFIFGALLWVGALVALASTLTEGAAWALSRLAVAAVIVGATLHAIDGVLNAVALSNLARAWVGATEGERTALIQNSDLLFRVLDATWTGVITLFHGAPFVLAGLAVALSQRFPAWLGWVGVLGGGGSLVIGVAMIIGVQTALAVPFAVVLSFFMVVLGGMLWVQADRDLASPSRP